LAIAIANGTYDELYRKWFSPILPPPPVPLTLILKYLLFILVPIMFLLGIMGLWYLKREVAQKTQSLNKEITDRKKAEEELSKLNLELEERVKQRTEQLEVEIAERIRAEEMLRKNKEMLQMIFDGISDPLLMLNAKLEVRLLNKAASEYYVVDQESVLGKVCYQAFRGRSAACEGCEIQAAIFNHYYEMFERKGYMDPTKVEKVVIYPIVDENDGFGSVIIRISDITEEKTLQRRIVQTEKLSSLGFLVSGVAHEINNPNNFITFNIPILKEYLNEIIPIIDDYSKKHEDLEICCMAYPEFRNDIFKLVKNIENGSRRIQAAVSNLKGITRVKDKLQMDMIDIQEVIEKCVSICRAKIDRLVKSFEVDIPKALPETYADPETLELVIINLLINAAQAADKDNSWIRLNVSLGDSQRNYLIIEVRDNGGGMDEKTQNHIFDPFFTTKSASEGTGLGLTLCLNSIKEMGGQIEVDSIQGKGSTFKVILPDEEKNRGVKA
jgi:signal transduction histidine kinase